MEIIDDETGKVFDCYLIDDGTLDTVIQVNGWECRYSHEYASCFRDESGALTDAGFIELCDESIDDYFMWIDTDVVPQKKFLLPNLALALKGDVVLTAPLTNFTGIEEQKVSGPSIIKEDVLVDNVPSLCYCMRYSEVEAFRDWEKKNRPKEPVPGLFDPNFFPCMYEDSDFCYRITYWWKKQIKVVGSTFVLHYGGSSVSTIEDKHAYVLNVQDNMKRYNEKACGAFDED